MCTSPIRIKNKTKVLSEDNTRYKMYVPCGHCEDCRAQMAEDWMQRSWCECQEFDKKGGKTIFLTYTYDDEHLPWFEWIDDDGHVDRFKCFNKAHYDYHTHAILDRFRRDLSKIRGCPRSKVGKIDVKWIFAGEFGMRKDKTHRPHFHALWHLPKEICDYYGQSDFAYMKLFQDFWPFGLIRKDSKKSIFVNSEFAPIYTSKYMCKDVGFFQQPEVERYLNVSDPKELKRRIEAAKDVFPHHYQSKHYGEALVEKYDDLNTYVFGLNLNLKSEIEHKAKPVYHKIPKYIEEKLLKKKDMFGRLVLTEKGVSWKLAKFYKTLDKSVDKMQELASRSEFDKRTAGIDLRNTNHLRSFENLDQLYDFITSILDNRDHVIELILYNRVWSGKFTKDEDFLWKLGKCSHDEFVCHSLQSYYDALVYPYKKFLINGIFTEYDPTRDPDVIFFDDCGRFCGMHHALCVIGAVENYYRKSCHRKYLQDRECRKSMVNDTIQLFDVKSA